MAVWTQLGRPSCESGRGDAASRAACGPGRPQGEGGPRSGAPGPGGPRHPAQLGTLVLGRLGLPVPVRGLVCDSPTLSPASLLLPPTWLGHATADGAAGLALPPSASAGPGQGRPGVGGTQPGGPDGHDQRLGCWKTRNRERNKGSKHAGRGACQGSESGGGRGL